MSLIFSRVTEVLKRDDISEQDLIESGFDPISLRELSYKYADTVCLISAGLLIDALWRLTGLRYSLDDLFVIEYELILVDGVERDILIRPDGTWIQRTTEHPWGIMRRELKEIA